jgi:hypothetical protein
MGDAVPQADPLHPQQGQHAHAQQRLAMAPAPGSEALGEVHVRKNPSAAM